MSRLNTRLAESISSRLGSSVNHKGFCDVLAVLELLFSPFSIAALGNHKLVSIRLQGKPPSRRADFRAQATACVFLRYCN
jgi:hypothetical protein